jgi:hydrogenase maturation protein HypF
MTVIRRHFVIKGFVQGVGFRPFIYLLAKKLELSGWVLNNTEGVLIEVQGPLAAVDSFIGTLDEAPPKNAVIYQCDISEIHTIEEKEFTILESQEGSNHQSFILPDMVVCTECIRDVTNPENRRYRYPFTNCINCGPRFSIIEKIPYDRASITMQAFKMCDACLDEYENPEDRRFHAQPNACPQCGPHLELWDPQGKVVAVKDSALTEACRLIQNGSILAIKGIGGFQLIVDASNDKSIQYLRDRKCRQDKPFALMYPNIEQVKRDCVVSPLEEQLLTSKESPIVIMRSKCFSSPLIAPNNPNLGVMLPYSPLHFLMMQRLNAPVIATSANIADDPICIDEKQALEDLQGIADYFLVHNRPIAHPIDDSIVRVVDGKKFILRRARGYSSIPIITKHRFPPSLGVGGHLKNTIAVARDHIIYVSQHLGNLDTQKGCDGFNSAIQNALKVYSIDPEFVVSDHHPDYHSTRVAATFNIPLQRCQHHEAHVYSCMAEKGLEPPLLGVSWDGTGYGSDGTIWGGEFFRVDNDYSMQRVATIRSFQLICGEKSVHEPRLVGLSLLYEIFGSSVFSMNNLPVIQYLSDSEIVNYEKILSRGLLSPRCSSMGRLFDGLSSLLGLRQRATFEGQAAMELEFLSELSDEDSAYLYEVVDGVIDWEPMLRQILKEIDESIPTKHIAAKFHNTLVEIIMTVAKAENLSQVVLSGGVFQNKQLVEKAVQALNDNGFTPYTHQEIPPNDGGISCGQLYSLLQLTNREETLCVLEYPEK